MTVKEHRDTKTDLSCYHRAAQRREQAWEQLVSLSQEELSSTIGRQLMETLPCTTKVDLGQKFEFKRYSQELPSTPASATQVALVCNALPPILNICFCIVFYRMDPRPLFYVRTTNTILYKYDVI